MNRKERRERLKLQAKEGAALHRRKGRTGARDALDVAQGLFQLGKAREALAGLRQAVADWPQDSALNGAFAYALAATGQIGAAIAQYRLMLEQEPDAVPVLTNLALLLVQAEKPDEARVCLERAAVLAPGHANTAFALAELEAGQRRKEEAFKQYRRAAELFRLKIGPEPRIEHCDDLVKVAAAELWMGDPGQALRHLDQAVELRPDHALALARRGAVLTAMRRPSEAIASFRRAAAADPRYAETRRALGDLLLGEGKAAAAEKQLQAAVRINSKDEWARFLLSAARNENPESPPLVYAQKLFDNYAQNFDSHLVEMLRYRAPQLTCDVVMRLAGGQRAQWQIVDIGCGTGLNGPLIRPLAKYLIGLDLSREMVEEARKKSAYDELWVGDATQLLAAYDGVFDLALCTDVMIYLGSLTPIFAAAARALKPGALFAFTTEIHAGEGFVLDKSRRYLHSPSYIEAVATAHGFAIIHVEPIVARYENTEPDVHNLFVARRQSDVG